MSGQPNTGQRRTRQRAEVERELDGLEDFVSAQELHRRLAARGADVGLATVYRSLQAMADASEVDVLRTDTGESVYRRCDVADHHHHLVCRECGTAVEIARPAVEAWAAEVASQHGFTDVTHVVENFGLCPKCSASD
jgi:Fur family ferric uptake transcriptional regulator